MPRTGSTELASIEPRHQQLSGAIANLRPRRAGIVQVPTARPSPRLRLASPEPGGVASAVGACVRSERSTLAGDLSSLHDSTVPVAGRPSLASGLGSAGHGAWLAAWTSVAGSARLRTPRRAQREPAAIPLVRGGRDDAGDQDEGNHPAREVRLHATPCWVTPPSSRRSSAMPASRAPGRARRPEDAAAGLPDRD